jgi:hypothetical protein
MIYELHLTVDHNHPDFTLDRWKQFCDRFGAKPLDIRLAAEVPPRAQRQVMFALVREGDDSGAWRWMHGFEHDAQRSGFKVLRSKLEVPLDKSAPYHSPEYHETHIKSLIPAQEVDVLVPQLCDMGWVASYNALFPRDAGLEKWYFTQRAYGVSFTQAGREFAESYAALTEINWHTVRMEKETVIEDTNPSLDEGWA